MNVAQTAFRQALLDPSAERPFGLSDGHGHAAGRRFDVYRNNVAVSLREALESAFPVIRKLVGEENFRILASTFLRQYPPSSPLMMFYGGDMPRFLSRFEPTKPIGYLPDIARLEIAIRESYHAEDAVAAETEYLQALNPVELMQVRLGLAPSLRVVRSEWPIESIWKFNMEPDAPKPQMMAQDVVVLRPNLDPYPFLLPSGGGLFIEKLIAKATLGDAIEAVSDLPDFDLTAVLTLLIGNSAITSIGD